MDRTHRQCLRGDCCVNLLYHNIVSIRQIKTYFCCILCWCHFAANSGLQNACSKSAICVKALRTVVFVVQ